MKPLCLVLFAAVLASMPGWGFRDPKEPSADSDPVYDPATLIDITGRIESIRDVAGANPLRGIHLDVTAESKAFDVHLGPASFVKEFESFYQEGSTIQVIGSKVKCRTGDVLLARELRRGGTTLYLREKDGTPLWRDR
jgi:hypothetical protein